MHRYWYPLTFFLSLALQPTALLAVNGDLVLPKQELRVGSKPSLHAYLPALSSDKKEEVGEISGAAWVYAADLHVSHTYR